MNIIITAAAGYTPEAIEIFMRSASRHCPAAKRCVLVLGTQEKAFRARFRDIPNVEWIRLPRKFNKGIRFYYGPLAAFIRRQGYPSRNTLVESLGRFALHIALERYFYALDIVQAQRESLDNVLLCDSRDVVIQKDPFACHTPEVTCGVEERTLENCPFNADWVRHIYGAPALHEMAGWRIVCSGVTLGPVAKIEEYLLKMCAEMWRYLPKLLRRGWYDQGVHNRLFFEQRLGYRLTGNQECCIATLGYEDVKNITTDPSQGRVHVRGICPAIVHQYDRFPHLIDFYNAAYRR